MAFSSEKAAGSRFYRSGYALDGGITPNNGAVGSAVRTERSTGLIMVDTLVGPKLPREYASKAYSRVVVKKKAGNTGL